MSFKAALEAEYSRVMAQRAHLGAPKPGDPEQLFAYAQFLESEAAKAGDLAHHEGTIAERIDFDSDGAKRLFANMAEVAASYISAADTLDHAAQMITRAAHQLADEQATWIAQYTRCDTRLNEIAGELKGLAT